MGLPSNYIANYSRSSRYNEYISREQWKTVRILRKFERYRIRTESCCYDIENVYVNFEAYIFGSKGDRFCINFNLYDIRKREQVFFEHWKVEFDAAHVWFWNALAKF